MKKKRKKEDKNMKNKLKNIKTKLPVYKMNWLWNVMR
jgi:hypothetical protein